MSHSRSETEHKFQFPLYDVKDNSRLQMQVTALSAELRTALAREEALLREKLERVRRQAMLAQEFEHRLVNSLQLISSLLSLQSRAAASPDAAAQLAVAARRVNALGRVHYRLHLLDHQETVEFGEYLNQLCEDLSGLLFSDGTGHIVDVECVQAEIPSTVAIPLGFIVNELITNAAKYAKSNVTVRFETTAANHSLSVSDDGPGLPKGFSPKHGKGLGMKIVQSLVAQIGGELQFSPGDMGCGSRFTVIFGR